VWLSTPTTTYGNINGQPHPCITQGTCTAGARVDPGMTVSSLAVPLIAPNTEYADRINQLDLSISKRFRANRFSFEPKIDFFNLLNVSPVISVERAAGSNYGTAAYMQPDSVLVGRVNS
jgi:hypothetical protein